MRERRPHSTRHIAPAEHPMDNWPTRPGTSQGRYIACPTIRLLHSGNPKARREISVGRGWVAQLAEQRTENPRVGGSIPPPATPLKSRRVQQILQQNLAPVECMRCVGTLLNLLDWLPDRLPAREVGSGLGKRRYLYRHHATISEVYS